MTWTAARCPAFEPSELVHPDRDGFYLFACSVVAALCLLAIPHPGWFPDAGDRNVYMLVSRVSWRARRTCTCTPVGRERKGKAVRKF